VGVSFTDVVKIFYVYIIPLNMKIIIAGGRKHFYALGTQFCLFLTHMKGVSGGGGRTLYFSRFGMILAPHDFDYKTALYQYVFMVIFAKLRVGNEQWCLVQFAVTHPYHSYLTSTLQSEHSNY
jgi:hypothetical protein